jgi:hypothetical protein
MVVYKQKINLNILNIFSNKKGKDCCSTTAIGFHRVTNEEQYKMEYLMYWLNKQYKIESSKNQYLTPGTT